MANIKAVIAILVIIIVIMSLVMIRCLCWKWCKSRYCPDGITFCEDSRPVIITHDPERVHAVFPPPNAPPPPYNPDAEGHTNV
jgi:hypothetical protein